LHRAVEPIAAADRPVPAGRTDDRYELRRDPRGQHLIESSIRRPPDYVLEYPTGPYLGLNPSTKLVIAFAEAAVAFVVRGWTGPIVVLALVLVTAAISGVGRRVRPFVLATLPLVVSILLVNTFLFPGA